MITCFLGIVFSVVVYHVHFCEGLSLCLANVDGFPSKNKSVSSSHLGYCTPYINKPNKSMKGYNLRSHKRFSTSLDSEVDYVNRRNIKIRLSPSKYSLVGGDKFETKERQLLLNGALRAAEARERCP